MSSSSKRLLQNPQLLLLLQLLMVLLMIIVAVITTPINALTNSVKHDENSSVPGQPDSGIKCTACSSCENPCNQILYPPPPPPPPSPPPPPKNPAKQYCPPPPPPPFFYITGQPGNLYPFDPDYSGARRVPVLGLSILIGCWSINGMFGFWNWFY